VKAKESLLMIRGMTAPEKNRLKREARATGDRTMSALVRKIINDYFKEKESGK
jgi:hypothetical protein